MTPDSPTWLYLMAPATGLIILTAGVIMTIWPPRSINPWYGHRTARSMQSSEHWEIAQRLSAQSMIRNGAIATGIGAIACIFPLATAILIGTGSGLVLLFFGLFRVERTLRIRFPDAE